jgi:hypothetical protein
MKLLNIHQVKLTSLKRKKHKVNRNLFAKPWKRGGTLNEFLITLARPCRQGFQGCPQNL